MDLERCQKRYRILPIIYPYTYFVCTYFSAYFIIFFFLPDCSQDDRRHNVGNIYYIRSTEMRGRTCTTWTTSDCEVRRLTTTHYNWTRSSRTAWKTFDQSERVSRAHGSAAGALMSRGGDWRRLS